MSKRELIALRDNARQRAETARLKHDTLAMMKWAKEFHRIAGQVGY